MKKIAVVSGGFDPIHVGHLRMFQEAKKMYEKDERLLIVILNNDNWLQAKKGFVFMNEEDRREILKGFECVDHVFVSTHKKNTKDMSILKELKTTMPSIFCNGGDRKVGNIPEYEFCKKNGIKMEFNVGKGKIRSSSTLVKDALKCLQESMKEQ